MKGHTLICATLATLLLASTAAAAGFREFAADLRSTMLTAQGRAKIAGYTQDHVYGETVDGTFKEGALVVVKAKPPVTVPEELYEDAAYGEVTGVLGKTVKVSVTKRVKELPRDGVIIGLRKLRVSVAGAAAADITPMLLGEPDIQVIDQGGDGVVRITAERRNAVIAYKVTLLPSGRLLMIGEIENVPVPVVAAAPAVPAPAAAVPVQAIAPPGQCNVDALAYDAPNELFWHLKGDKLSFTGPKSSSTREIGPGKIVQLHAESGKAVAWLASGETVIVGTTGDPARRNGHLLPGGGRVFNGAEGTVTDAATGAVVASGLGGYERLFAMNGGTLAGRTADSLRVVSDGKVTYERALPASSPVRVKGGVLYLYAEDVESVPLAGDYITPVLYVIDLAAPSQPKRHELKEPVVLFDIDERTGEIVYLHRDGCTRRAAL